MSRRRFGADHGPRPLVDSLDAAAARVAGSPVGAAALFSKWEEIAGAELAPHCTPMRLDRGELVVSVDEPARATVLRMSSGEVLRRAREVTGAPAERLSVVVRRR